MSIKRGGRRSVIVEAGRWRFRLAIGRFRQFAFEQERHDDARSGRVEVGMSPCLALVGVAVLVYLTTR